MTEHSLKGPAVQVLIVLILGLVGPASAKPSYSVSCGKSGCHTRSRSGMTVTGHDSLTDLGGGDLKTFTVQAGQSVEFSVNVTDGHNKYAVVLEDFEDGGIVEDNSNRIVFTPDPAWRDYTSKSQPYYASSSSGHSWGGSARQFAFNMHVDEATPADFYGLQFEIGGKNGGKWAQGEKFYLHVLPGAPVPGDGDIDEDGDVDFDDFTLLALRWSEIGCGEGNGFCSGADINIDGGVDSNDLMVIASRWLMRKPLAIAVADGSDDAEESLADAGVSLTSSDLELVRESDDQLVGIRFNNVELDAESYISKAYIQFTVDETDTGACELIIEGQASDSSATFTNTDGDISSRPRTDAFAEWSVPAWNSTGEAGLDQRTPDLTKIIREIIIRPGWLAGNSLSFILSGSGTRTAESYDGVSNSAPVLHVEFQ